MAAEPRSDDELLAAWRDGDAQAGSHLFDRHAACVARFFRNKLPEQVDEMIQQTFLSVIESRDRYQPGRSFRAFLLGIARHKLIDHLRKTHNRTFELEREPIAELMPSQTSVLARKREHRLLLEGLRRIPIEHQIILELSYWEGLNAAQMAEMVGISHSAMRSRVSKARALLAQALASLADSKELLDSTVDGLDVWAAEIRGKI